MVKELEQFIGKGNERVFWLFTMKNAGGLVGGGLLGSRLGDLLGGGGVLLLCLLLGAAAGVIVTLDRRGLMWGRRWWLAGRWYARRAYRPTVIDAAAWYAVVDERETPIVIQVAGKTLVAPLREGGAP
jgi:hypothetical protein